MAGSSEADLEGNNKGAWSRYHLRHAAVSSDQQSSHACAGLGEEGAVAEDKESAISSRGEAENYDRSLGILPKLSLIVNTPQKNYTCKMTSLLVNNTLLTIYQVTSITVTLDRF